MRRLAQLPASHPALTLGAAAFALHLWASGGYDYFSDELYFIVCGKHLAWGYVDQPPLVPLIARIARELFGDSLRGLRLVPTLAATALTALTADTARRLGGGLLARWLAGLAALVAPVFLGVAQTLSTDSVQPLVWLAASLALIAAIESDNLIAWCALGAIAGVGILDKYIIVFFLIAAAIALLLTPQRRVLSRPGPWLAAGLALLIAAPNLLWQQSQGWPFLEISAAAFNDRNIAYSPFAYLGQQILLIGPLAAPIWISGLVAFAFWPRFAAMRWIAIAWVVLMAMMLLTRGKSYYPAGIYPILLAGGTVVIEAKVRHGAARAALVCATALGGLVLLPLVLPVLPVERFIAYERAIGLGAKPTALDKQPLGLLPPNYASMFGYREMAAAVGGAYETLAPKERSQAVFLGRGYDEAAAIDVFAESRHLPPAISGHNNYFLWGPGGHDGSVVFLLSTAPHDGLLAAYGWAGPAARIGEPEAIRRELLRAYGSVEPVTRIDNVYAQPSERGLTLWLCHDRKIPLAKDWAALKSYR